MDKDSIAEIVIKELEYLIINSKDELEDTNLLDFKHYYTATELNIEQIKKNIDKDLIIECIGQFLEDNDLTNYSIGIYGFDMNNEPTQIYIIETEKERGY